MTPFESYLEPARARSGFWRVILGILMILFCWIVGMIAVLAVWVGGKIAAGVPLAAALEHLDALQQGGTPTGILIMLLSFGGIWLGVFVTVITLHAQRFRTIFAPRGKPMALDFAKGLLLAVAIAIPQTILGLQVSDPISGLPLQQWVTWVVPVILLVFVQATGEELIFRGYVLQQLATRKKSWVVWALLPSLAFGLMHYAGRPDGQDFYYIAVTTIVGVTFCVLVWRSGSLLSAMGFHVGINALALTIIGPEGTLGGTQLFLFPEDDFLALIQMDLAICVLVLVFVLSPLGRVFDVKP